MEEELQIVVLSVLKTKKDKIRVEYGFQEKSSDYFKGITRIENWLDDTNFFNNFPESLFLKPLRCLFHYKKLFNGTAIMEITDIFDNNGVSIHDSSFGE